MQELAERHYEIPGSRRTCLSAKTIAAWYYAYRDHGIDGLVPRPRRDRGQSQIAAEVQEQILAYKQENPSRSLRQIQSLLEAGGPVAQGSVSRSAIHRLLQRHGLSRPGTQAPEEKRSFVVAHARDLWYGDVLHGPGSPSMGNSARSIGSR